MLLDTLLAGIIDASLALVRSYGGYSTNVPLNDLETSRRARRAALNSSPAAGAW